MHRIPKVSAKKAKGWHIFQVVVVIARPIAFHILGERLAIKRWIACQPQWKNNGFYKSLGMSQIINDMSHQIVFAQKWFNWIGFGSDLSIWLKLSLNFLGSWKFMGKVTHTECLAFLFFLLQGGLLHLWAYNFHLPVSTCSWLSSRWWIMQLFYHVNSGRFILLP
jgi:hypothetical protein